MPGMHHIALPGPGRGEKLPKKLQRCPASVRARSNQRGKQYRIEKQAQGAPVGNNNRAIQRGNESQKPCLFEKTAEKIAAVSGVSPRTIKSAG